MIFADSSQRQVLATADICPPISSLCDQSVPDPRVLGIQMPKAKRRLPTSAAQPIEVCRYSNCPRTASTITPIADGGNGDTLLT